MVDSANRIPATEECRFCHSVIFDRVIELPNGVVFRCKQCQLAVTDPFLWDMKNINIRTYDSQYISNQHSKRQMLEQRWKHRITEIEKLVPGGRLLDVGCGSGLFLYSVKKYAKRKWDVYGVDINRNNVVSAKSLTKLTITHGSLLDVPYRSNYFDVITFFDVIEHDPDFIKTLRKAYTLLKTQGIIVIQTPNYKSLMAALCQKYWDWWSIPDHVFHFSTDTLIGILKSSGFITSSVLTWEEKEDFLTNLSSTVHGTFPKYIYINKLSAKLVRVIISAFYPVIYCFERIFNQGGLILIYAHKHE